MTPGNKKKKIFVMNDPHVGCFKDPAYRKMWEKYIKLLREESKK